MTIKRPIPMYGNNDTLKHRSVFTLRNYHDYRMIVEWLGKARRHEQSYGYKRDFSLALGHREDFYVGDWHTTNEKLFQKDNFIGTAEEDLTMETMEYHGR